MTRTRWMVGALIVVTVGSAAYFRETAEAETPRLTTATVSRGAVVAKVEATGTVQPVDTVEVGTQVSGTIKTLAADFNSRVKKGQVIAMLDAAVLESQVAQARATVAKLAADLNRTRVQVRDADVKLTRARTLMAAQLIPQSDLDTAQVTYEAAQADVTSSEAQLKQAQASLAQSQENLSHTVITTPVDGIVLSRNVEVGQTVAAGLQAPTLFVIARDLGTMQVNASVDEADIGHVRTGQPVTFHVDAYGAETFAGRVSQVRLQPLVAQNVVSYTTVIAVQNPGGKLMPGMTATVTIEVGRVEDAQRVPAAALRFKPSADLLASMGRAQSTPDRLSDGRTERVAGDAKTPRSGAPANRAVVWQFVNGTLRPVRVHTALSDGSMVALEGAPLDEAALVVTGLQATVTAQTAPAASSSPLTPSFPRRGGARRGN